MINRANSTTGASNKPNGINSSMKNQSEERGTKISDPLLNRLISSLTHSDYMNAINILNQACGANGLSCIETNKRFESRNGIAIEYVPPQDIEFKNKLFETLLQLGIQKPSLIQGIELKDGGQIIIYDQGFETRNLVGFDTALMNQQLDMDRVRSFYGQMKSLLDQGYLIDHIINDSDGIPLVMFFDKATSNIVINDWSSLRRIESHEDQAKLIGQLRYAILDES